MTTLAELKAEHDELAKKIAAFEVKWPKNGNEYFCVSSSGKPETLIWYDDVIDQRLMEQGLVFRTAAEAEKQRQRNIVMKKLRDLAGGFKPDWGGESQHKHYLYLDHHFMNWRVSSSTIFQNPSVIYFRSKEEAQHAIDTLGDELKVLL